MNDEPSPPKKPLSAYLKYSSMGFQMAGSIILFAVIGHYTDFYMHTTKAYFTLVGLLVGTIFSIYALLRQLK